MQRYHISIFFFFLFVHDGHSASGAWSPTWVDLFWDNNANWTGATFPDGIDQIAAFIDWPNTNTINSTKDITISSLHMDIVGRSVTIGFTNNILIFDKTSQQHNQATIFIPSGQTHYIDTPILLNSTLAIFIGISSSIYFSKPISGPHPVLFYIDPSTHINYNSANTYTGDTIIYSGNLDLNGPLSATNIPGDLTIHESGVIYHGPGVSNNYTASAKVTILGGEMNLGGTTQTIRSTELTKQGRITGQSGGTLRLTDATNAITISDGSLAFIDQIEIVNGGNISNSPSSFGPGIFLGQVAPQGFTNIDLNNNSVIIQANNGSFVGPQKYDIQFVNAHFSDGTLEKQGLGQIVLIGNSVLTDLNIQQGAVQIGSNDVQSITDGPAEITINNGSILKGFGSLGTLGNVTVNNITGFFYPGDLFTIGEVFLSGSYIQQSGGQLLIQGKSPELVNTLNISNGNANISGTLYFMAIDEPDIHEDDLIVLIDASDGNITGRFDNFYAYLPDGLGAELIYTGNQVIMRVISCQ